MKFYDKSILLSNLTDIYNLLEKDIYTSSFAIFPIYNDKIAINHYRQGYNNIIRMWKTKVLFNYWYDDFRSDNFIGALDYKINNDHIKIEFLNIADEESYPYNQLNSIDSDKLTKALIDFTINKAKEENKQKIIIDVHSNLRLYDKYYKYNNFKVTNRKCVDNPYWIETELVIE